MSALCSLALLTTGAHALPRARLTRRSALGAHALPARLTRRSAIAALLLPPAASAITGEEVDALEAASLRDPGRLLPNGVRVFDVLEGTGPLPQRGERVYSHFKVWTGGFRSGPPADSSFEQARVYESPLGTPTARMPAGAAEAAVGMREGGWRRMIIPAELAYGDAGLRKLGPTGAPSRTYAVPPKTDVYFDLRIVDGGSGRCASVLHPPGVSDEASLRLKSISCVRGMP